MKTITEMIGGAQALLDINFEIQRCFEEKLSAEQKTFLQAVRVIETYMEPLVYARARTGRPAYEWMPFVKSMIAKSFFQIEKTSHLIGRLQADPNLRLLCGFKKVPSAGKFSTAFAYLSEQNIIEKCFEDMAAVAHENHTVLHVCRDSTAITAREKAPSRKEKKAEKQAKTSGKRGKNALKTPKEPTVIQRQITEDAEASLAALNKNCAWGCKKNSQGNISFWKGYKLHLDVTDTGFPVTAVVTGANVHDSQVAIPMEKLTSRKIQHCYSLMDSAFDSKDIRQYILDKGRVPVIDPNKRKNKSRPPLDPAKQERYKIRTTVERGYSMLKDWLIPRAIYVKGFRKVSFVLLASVLCMAALRFIFLALT